MGRIAAYGCLLVGMLGLAQISRASVTATTGAVVFVSNPPTNLSTGAWQSDTQIQAFDEAQDLTLSQAINIDISTPGTSPNASTSNLSPATIAAGTVVNSYALHFDVDGAPPVGDAYELTGSITVSDPIIGLIVLSNSLTATNSILGIPGDTYPFGSDYGLELNPAGGGTSDIITLGSDDHTVTVDWRDASSADNIRIITEVPEPGTEMAWLGLAACVVFGWKRRGSAR